MLAYEDGAFEEVAVLDIKGGQGKRYEVRLAGRSGVTRGFTHAHISVTYSCGEVSKHCEGWRDGSIDE